MGGKVLVMDKVIVVANFNNKESTTSVNVPSAGEWTNLMTGEKVQLGSSHSFALAASDYIVLVKE
jgi:purine-cytosine permease-like protein